MVEYKRENQMSLTPMSVEHTSYIVEWRNDPENAHWFLEKHVFTPEGHERWLAQQLLSNASLNWVLVDPNGIPLGAVALYDIDTLSRKAEFGRLVIGRSYQGRGFGSAAISLVIDRAVSLGLCMIYLSVKKSNTSAISLYEKSGFLRLQEENDQIYMELILEDFLKRGAGLQLI